MDSVKKFNRTLAEATPDYIYERYVNFRNGLKRYPHRVLIDNPRQLIKVSDGKDEIYVCRRNRLWLYKKTISNRIERLKRAYLLHLVGEDAAGAFIDCGANVGELGYFARQKNFAYFAFEPETLEADCCDLNNYGGKSLTNRFALWSEKTTLSFYSKPDTGDSSIFETNDFSSVKKVEAIPLDDFIAERGIDRIAVMKIEAEGAEPEILAGAQRALSISKYLTVDCGFERGLEKKSTLVPVVNAATKAGFSMVEWNPQRLTVLFRNDRLTD